MIDVRFYEYESDVPLKFAVIYAETGGRTVWCRHRERSTWEFPGGHIESGETAVEAAERELREETGATRYSLKPVCVYSVEKDGVETFGALFFAEIFAFGPLENEIAELAISANPPGEWTYPEIQPHLMAKVMEKSRPAPKKKRRALKLLALVMVPVLLFAGAFAGYSLAKKRPWIWESPVVRSIRVWNWHGSRDYQAALARIRRVDCNAADNAVHISYGDGAGYWFVCQEHSSYDPPQTAHNSVWYVNRDGAQLLYSGDDMHFVHQYFRDARILYFRTGIDDNNFFQTDLSDRKLSAYIVGSDGPVQLELPDSYIGLRPLPTEDSPYAIAESGFDRRFLTVRGGELRELAGKEMALDQFLASSFGARQLLDRITSENPGSEVTGFLRYANGMITINLRYADGKPAHLYAWIENDVIQYETDWQNTPVIHAG